MSHFLKSQRFDYLLRVSLLTALVSVGVFVVSPIVVHAQGFVPCGNTADNPCTIAHLFKAFVVIINYLITMAGLLAVAAIVYAGFSMVWAQGNEGALKAAKARLTGAIIGLVIVSAAFVIINSVLEGSLSVGVRNGGSILSDPLQYIQGP